MKSSLKRIVLTTLSQKFRTYILDSEKAMDLVAYTLAYGLDIKDKPGMLSNFFYRILLVLILLRTTWNVSSGVLYHSKSFCGARFWSEAGFTTESRVTSEVGTYG